MSTLMSQNICLHVHPPSRFLIKDSDGVLSFYRKLDRRLKKCLRKCDPTVKATSSARSVDYKNISLNNPLYQRLIRENLTFTTCKHFLTRVNQLSFNHSKSCFDISKEITKLNLGEVMNQVIKDNVKNSHYDLAAYELATIFRILYRESMTFLRKRCISILFRAALHYYVPNDSIPSKAV